MRKYIASVITTVDGYFEGPGRDVMAMPFDDGFSRYNLELLRNAGAVAHGSRWFDGGAAWSRVAADETQPEIERINAPLDRLVISDSLRLDPSWPWADRVRIVPVVDGPAVHGLPAAAAPARVTGAPRLRAGAAALRRDRSGGSGRGMKHGSTIRAAR